MMNAIKRLHKHHDLVKNYEVIFLARSKQSVISYRKGLIKYLTQFLSVDQSGVFVFLLRPWLWKSYKLLVTSDTICNLICLNLSIPQLMILNGLGRYRNVHLFRSYLIYSINRKASIEVCVQNYLDYRYLRKRVRKKIYWIPGSGGTSRMTGQDENPVVITRDAKFKKQIHALRNVEKYFSKIHIVGLQKTNLKNNSYINWGRRVQNSIFSEFKIFLQLDGYGEGVPHSLVDAICSNMDIYMTKRSWIQFGFHKLICSSANIKSDNNGFLFLKSNSDKIQELKLKLLMSAINAQYAKYILQYLHRG